MPLGTNTTRSAAGSRGYIRVGYAGVLSRYSTGSISLGGSPSSHNQERTWWLVEDFDRSSQPNIDSFFMLPCDNVTFNLGDDLYKNADDAVPGAMRMRASRCGAYTFKMAFPVIISNDPTIIGAYGVVSNVVQRANYMMSMNTSLQKRNYTCITQSFSIKVDGYNGANPIECQMTARGLSHLPDMDGRRIMRSFITDTTRRDKEDRTLNNISYPAPDVTGAAGTYGGRLANIKDCTISLDNSTFQQIVSMELSIEHELNLASTAKSETLYPNNTPTIHSADRIFLRERVVKGSFKVLESYASALDLSSISLTSNYADTFSLADGHSQWASPLHMSFGPYMDFNMPAVYWQPRVEDLSSGSPLITINFIARSNVRGISEFMHSLDPS